MIEKKKIREQPLQLLSLQTGLRLNQILPNRHNPDPVVQRIFLIPCHNDFLGNPQPFSGNLRQKHSIVLTEELPELQAESPLLLANAQAFDWQQKLDRGEYGSLEALAVAVGKERACVSRTLRLALLSPEIIHRALSGGLSISAKALLFTSIPADSRGAEESGGDVRNSPLEIRGLDQFL